MELVSPILKGYEGLRKVKRVLTLLNKNNVYVDRECGLHVHVGVADLTILQILSIGKRYSILEHEIDKLVALRRRYSKNYFC